MTPSGNKVIAPLYFSFRPFPFGAAAVALARVLRIGIAQKFHVCAARTLAVAIGIPRGVTRARREIILGGLINNGSIESTYRAAVKRNGATRIV